MPALWGAAALLALALPLPFVGALALYLLLMVAYSMRLRNYAIVDALALALGYTLRIWAGLLAVALDVSPWLLVCSTALFFGLALLKRYAELVTLRSRPGAAWPRARLRCRRRAARRRPGHRGGLHRGGAAGAVPGDRRTGCAAPHGVVTEHADAVLDRPHVADGAPRPHPRRPRRLALRDPLSRAFGVAAAAVLLVTP